MQPQVDVKQTLADAIALMEIIDLCRARAEEAPSYKFGVEPPFATKPAHHAISAHTQA
jgi:hypothetical protein